VALVTGAFGQAAADAIRSETNGRLNIQLFPSNQLGTDTDTLGQLRSGGVELFTLSGLILSTLVPAAAINGVGFAFQDYQAAWNAMDARDVARRIGATVQYQRSRHERKKVEVLFAHLNRILKIDRLRLRGLTGAADEFTLAAAVQNLRRLAMLTSPGPPVQGTGAPS